MSSVYIMIGCESIVGFNFRGNGDTFVILTSRLLSCNCGIISDCRVEKSMSDLGYTVYNESILGFIYLESFVRCAPVHFVQFRIVPIYFSYFDVTIFVLRDGRNPFSTVIIDRRLKTGSDFCVCGVFQCFFGIFAHSAS
jgi:hypothetical protein